MWACIYSDKNACPQNGNLDTILQHVLDNKVNCPDYTACVQQNQDHYGLIPFIFTALILHMWKKRS